MMNLVLRPTWRVIKNGSNSYIKALREQTNCQWFINTSVSTVSRSSNGVTLHCDSGQSHRFDAVIFATHSDQALAMLDDPSSEEKQILGAIKYENNHMIVHTDESIMHPNKAAWASWNTEVPNEFSPDTLRCCTANYWMNLLQNLSIKTNVFATLNSHKSIDPKKVLIERHYSHPIFTANSVSAQKQKNLINGRHHTYYVGAYWGWGFHEDGARSAVETSRLINQQMG